MAPNLPLENKNNNNNKQNIKSSYLFLPGDHFTKVSFFLRNDFLEKYLNKILLKKYQSLLTIYITGRASFFHKESLCKLKLGKI